EMFTALYICLCGSLHGGKVLVWPGEFSHWLNMKTILDKLVEMGHTVTVITHTATPSVMTKRSAGFNFEILQVPHTTEDSENVLNEMLKYWMYDMEKDSFIQVFLKMSRAIDKMMAQNYALCRAMFAKKDLLEKLKMEQYDVVLEDPMSLCGDLVADVLGLPLVLTIRFSFGNTIERHVGKLPSPLSFRLKNHLFCFFHDVLYHVMVWQTWDHLYTELRGKPTKASEILGKADIWLIRTNWDFEYPRPFLPNFKFVGGLHCKPSKPLPDEMEKFVQSSGDDGIVVFTLGSMIKNLTTERANTIASALGQIPQKVLWRYSGVKPDTLGPNTKLFDWIPQNDLLGHPKTKAFITHGGTNGLYEAIYHGVPVVGLPLFAEQPDNLDHIRTKGAAVMLDFNKMDSNDLLSSMRVVINDPLYKENMMRLSKIHHDQPLTPLEQAVFWIEFVMRNKGAKHLRVQAHNLTWYQYHCLDVAACIFAIVGLIVFIFLKVCRFCLHKCCGSKQQKRKSE
uniref:UDP-glucuronosyltransferase n=1 Tax=Denticeps clupeoides TaxID=299321 RepID=A0AAY3ZYH7_9TELE